ncbi:MAG: dihydropteroate synthase [Granulosicoccus sp.]|nr:dihydropteroate synthase [Granulosicoccus sp.]
MGILNVTPDSFSDGGQFVKLDRALEQVESMLVAGADIVDIGGESTRPGARAVDVQAELDRLLPVIEAINERFDTIISLDTSKAAVMRAGVAAGVGMINDVRALREPDALRVAVESGLPVCLMHMQGEPRSMQHSPEYEDVVLEVGDFLRQRRQACIDAGMQASQIVLDPGFGFGKTLTHNLLLIRHLAQLSGDSPVLAGLSRKRMFAQILGSERVSRITASVSAALLCVQNGASIVRVHDVAPTMQALAVYRAVQSV